MSKDDKTFDTRGAIYTPPEVAIAGMDAIRSARLSQESGIGIGIDIPGIAEDFPPLMAGEICAVIAQTSNFKSGFLDFIEYGHAARLSELGRTDEIIIHISVEDLVEEQAYLQFARLSGDNAGQLGRGDVQNWDLLESVAVQVGTIPIFRIGASLSRSDDLPNLYMSNMIRAIQHLVSGEVLDFKPKISGLFVDYLQAFPIDPETRAVARDAQRRLQVRSDYYRLRQAAAHFACPVFVAIQAKQHLDGANPPIMLPGVYDGEESSAIAQRSDRVITLWMPKTTHQVGTLISGNGPAFTVRENLLWIKIAKQRGRLPAGRAWPCSIDYQSNTIKPGLEQI